MTDTPDNRTETVQDAPEDAPLKYHLVFTPRRPAPAVVAEISYVDPDPDIARAQRAETAIVALFRSCLDVTPQQVLARLPDGRRRKMRKIMTEIGKWLEKAKTPG